MDEKTLRQRIGQLLVVGFEGLTVPDLMADLIRTHAIGNVILFSRNIASKNQLAALSQHLQHIAKENGQTLPLIICADQENGIVRRLPPDIPGLPGNMALGATGESHLSRLSGAMTGRLLRRLGINMNLAPVLDINNNARNPVIGVRSFSDRPEEVAEWGRALMTGLQSEGVIACGKHFPGHGDTRVDSHLDLPIIAHARDHLHHVELLPFREVIKAGIDSIMTAHIVFPKIEPDRIPATLSRRVLTGLLREELGFDGVITTDCLEMNAIAETVGVGSGAVQALAAGADMVMISHRLDRQIEAIEAIAAAVQDGRLTESRIEEAYRRVQELKQKRLTHKTHKADNWDALLAQTLNLQQQVSQRAVTILKSSPDFPLKSAKIRHIAILTDEIPPKIIAAGPTSPRPLLSQAAHRVFPQAHCTEYAFPSILTNQSGNDLLKSLQHLDLILTGINGHHNTPYLTFVHTLIAQTKAPHAVLLLRSPYDANLVSNASTLIALYENTPWMAETALKALLGQPAEGRLPVTVSPRFARQYRA